MKQTKEEKLIGLNHATTVTILLQIMQDRIDKASRHKFVFRQELKRASRLFEKELETTIKALYKDMSEEAEMQMYKLQEILEADLKSVFDKHEEEYLKYLKNEYSNETSGLTN